MTTAQESTNGHHSPLPPCSFPDSQIQNQSEESTNNNPNSASATQQPEAFRASAYHVPPKLYAPKADSFHDTIPDGLSTMKMPDRCQFMFSDGRQCTMTRSDIHPSLCPYHSEREEQLFGTPHTRGLIRGDSLDLPELFSASRDLSTATGVNRALGQVFRLFAQRRISRQEAATFAKLAHLLLQSIRAASQEQPMSEVVERENAVPSRESHGHQELSRVTKSTALFAHKKVERSAQTVSAAVNSPAPTPPPAARPAPSPARTVVNDSSGMNTSAAVACNSPEISTYKNVGLEAAQNQHLLKGENVSSPRDGRHRA